MNDESGHKAGSKDSPLTLDRSLSNSEIKPMKPCEICGSVADEPLIMTCFQCRETREHIYCTKGNFRRVPDMWLCEACRGYSKIANRTAISRTIQVEKAVVDNEAAPSSKANQVDQVMEDNKTDSIEQATILTRTNQAVANEDFIDQTVPASSRTNQVDQTAPASLRTNQVDQTAPASSRTNQVEQVVPHILDQSTTEESSLESSCPLSPSSLVFKPQWEKFMFNRSEYVDLSSDSGSEE